MRQPLQRRISHGPPRNFPAASRGEAAERDRLRQERTVSVGLKMAANKRQLSTGATWAALALLLVVLFSASCPLCAQSSANQSPSDQGQTKPAQSDLPDAPTVQPAPA